MNLTEQKQYRANMTAGALLVLESRKIAGLMLSKVGTEQWKNAIEHQNILQKRSITTARRISDLIRSRLKLMRPDLWMLVKEGDSEVATHAVLAATIKYSPLLGDYINFAVRQQFKNLEERLSYRLWDEYIQQCLQRDPTMPKFPDSTAQKARANVHKILFEAGYIQDRRSMTLQHVDIASEVIKYLENNDEDYVLRCIQV